MIDRSYQDQIWEKPSKYQEYGECTAQKLLWNLCKHISATLGFEGWSFIYYRELILSA